MGRSKKSKQCPLCGGKDVLLQDTFDDGVRLYVCADCDYEFEVGHSRSKRRDWDDESEDEFDRETAGGDWDY